MKVHPEEGIARSLAALLVDAGVPARPEGRGVHWHVDAGPRGTRTVRIDCFHYGRGVSALMLGMNPGNARTGQTSGPSVPHEGAEYLTVLSEDGVVVADGRTGDLAAIEAAVTAWLAGRTLPELATIAPYVDARGRVMRALAARVDPALRLGLGGDPLYELWVYGERRSCCARPVGSGFEVTFWFGPAEIGRGRDLDDAASAIHRWLIDRPSIGELLAHVPGATLGRHAEVLGEDPARWHWLHVLDRIANPHDVLAPLRPLIESLAASPIATRFYSYSSLNRLCFSASSHYPWVDEDLPIIAPGPDGAVHVDGERQELGEALVVIEARLRASPVTPFFGSRANHDHGVLGEALARAGATWRPQLRQRLQWLDLVGEDAEGRLCEIQGLHVRFTEGATRLVTTWRTIDDLADVVRRFCEEGTPLADIADDPRATDITWPAR